MSLIHQVGHLVVEGDDVGHAGAALHEPTLSGPNFLVVLHIPCDYTQDDLFHNISQHQGQADRLIVPQMSPLL